MLVYSSTRAEFAEHVSTGQISDVIKESFKQALGYNPPPAAVLSFQNSLPEIEQVFQIGDIDDNAGVAVELQLPLSSKRVDIIVSGKDENQHNSAVIVELKQWERVRKTQKPSIVQTFLGGAERETIHPSYQAWSYGTFIRDYNAYVQDEGVRIRPCAFLHNCDSDKEVKSDFYKEDLDNAPLYSKKDKTSLAEFLKRNVATGDDAQIIKRIDESELRPSKHLIETLTALMQGNKEFILLDEQKIIYETALDLASQAAEDNRQVLLIHGGPGTGKSVLAINLLAALTQQAKYAQYITRNKAPRDVYKAKLTNSHTGIYTQGKFNTLFNGPHPYVDEPTQKADALIVDEAHRLSPKGGPHGNKGENQVMELIRASKLAVFFLDEDQRIIWKDIGTANEIRTWAEKYNATVTEKTLESQFRCNGSDGYLAWLSSALQIAETANPTLEGISYDFRVFDDPNDLRSEIVNLDKRGFQARMVAGFCWDWNGRRKPSVKDVKIPKHNFEMKWNLSKDGTKWIITPGTVSEIGCIYTCQGLELDYVGVIIGPDFVIRDGIVQTDALKISKHDKQSIWGGKQVIKAKNPEALKKADRIIKNIYRTLMTRGLKGCYLYCVDEETNDYFKKFVP